MHLREDTIVAISSPPGRSPRGLVRLTGPAVRPVLQRLLAAPSDLPERHLAPARLVDPPIPVLVALFPGPGSYTGSDVAELQMPGNPALLDRVVRQAIETGARLAEPGEFTFRAFLNGRLDLTQAEGVAATINAVSDSQLRAAAQLREGRLGHLSTAMVDHLGTQLALIEAGIDFTDQEDVTPIGPKQLDAQLAIAERDLAQLLGSARSWAQIEALPRVVLVGPPSSGKSTLFNALLGRSRAVVSATAGTTRDVLEEPLTLQDRQGRPVEVMLVDLAGLDTAAGPGIDADAQRQAQQAIARADLVLRIGDVDLPPGPTVLSIGTKADLQDTGEPLHVSAATGLRLVALRSAIVTALADRSVSLAGDALALQPRHEAALRAALDHVRQVRASLAPQRNQPQLDEAEVLAAGLRDALDHLAGLGGQLTPDEVIGRVFATFCVGK